MSAPCTTTHGRTPGTTGPLRIQDLLLPGGFGEGWGWRIQCLLPELSVHIGASHSPPSTGLRETQKVRKQVARAGRRADGWRPCHELITPFLKPRGACMYSLLPGFRGSPRRWATSPANRPGRQDPPAQTLPLRLLESEGFSTGHVFQKVPSHRPWDSGPGTIRSAEFSERS